MQTPFSFHKNFTLGGFEQQSVDIPDIPPNRRVGRGMTLLIYQILAFPLSLQQHLTCNLFLGFDILLLGK
jgi:hypothetical protein